MSFEQWINTQIFMPPLEYTYTCLTWATYTIWLINEGTSDSYFLAIPSNQIAQDEVNSLYEETFDHLAKLRFGQPYYDLSEDLQSMIPDIFANITRNYCWITAQHVAQDYYKQKEQRYRETWSRQWGITPPKKDSFLSP
jgi:hypothetical protein